MENNVTSYANGFELIYNGWDNCFRGLVSTTIPTLEGCISTALDGMPGSSLWYYAIGGYKECSYSNKILGPYLKFSVVVDLWVRATGFLNIAHKTYKTSQHILISNLIFILCFVS